MERFNFVMKQSGCDFKMEDTKIFKFQSILTQKSSYRSLEVKKKTKIFYTNDIFIQKLGNVRCIFSLRWRTSLQSCKLKNITFSNFTTNLSSSTIKLFNAKLKFGRRTIETNIKASENKNKKQLSIYFFNLAVTASFLISRYFRN